MLATHASMQGERPGGTSRAYGAAGPRQPGAWPLNAVLYRQMSRDIASAARLNKALERLGGYQEWSAEMRRELLEFHETLTENQRRARLLGREIDAALADPRWMAAG